jgi:hypothetical protein
MILNCYGKTYEQLVERMNREEFVLTPIFRDVYYHRAENVMLCVGIMFKNRDSYIVSITHDDVMRVGVKNPTFDMPTKITEDDVKILRYVNGQPVNSLADELLPYIKDTHHRFGMMRDANHVVPITVWATVLEEYNNALWDSLDEYWDTALTDRYGFTQRLVKVLRRIEDAGIAVNRELIPKFFDEKVLRSFKKNLAYTEYNPFTITGRPSNRFGGINYSALNKSDGSRSVFTTRYEEGMLVQIDFEAYHLRLVADMLNVDLPKGKSIHTELAKVYFGTEEITEEMYAASKAKTFEIMYGMSDETFNFELFEKIHAFRERYRDATHITLPSSIRVEVEMPNASKLFNYYVQSLEVVKTVPKLEKVLNLLENTENHLVLYTYDSILLDVKNYDPMLIKQIVDLLEEDKKFPVRVYAGKTYDTIEEIR